MAEAAGLAFAIVGLFNDSVDIFQYIQIGKNFGRDATTYALLLMHVQLDFSRWGEAVGLKDLDTALDPNDLDLASLAFPPEKLSKLKDTLEHVNKLLKASEEEAKKNKPIPPTMSTVPTSTPSPKRSKRSHLLVEMTPLDCLARFDGASTVEMSSQACWTTFNVSSVDWRRTFRPQKRGSLL